MFISLILVRTVISSPLPSEIKAMKGLRKILPCGVTKDPSVTPHFLWTKDGNAIDAVRMSVLSNGSLQISTVRDEDAGTYKCEVKSTVGNGTTSGRLVVQGTTLMCMCCQLFNFIPKGSFTFWKRALGTRLYDL